MEKVTLLVAFWGGILSFLSPCILPLIPSYISYITGMTYSGFDPGDPRPKIGINTIVNSLIFIAGFTFVFVLLGAVAAGFGKVFFEYREIIRIAGGSIVIIFGLHIMGVFRSKVLNSSFKLPMNFRAVGYFGTFIVGMIFAAGWTPCVGPILGTILVIAGTKQTVTDGMALLASFSLGLAIPFFISSLLINSFIASFRSINKYYWLINMFSGAFLILIGVLLITNHFQTVTEYLMIFS